MMQFEPMEVLYSVKEPFNKNTLWIYPNNENNIEIKVFDKGWKVLLTTEDLGLSEKSKQWIENLVNKNFNMFNFKFNKEYGKHKSTLLTLMNKNKELEIKINDLNNKIDKLTKRYGTLLAKN